MTLNKSQVLSLAHPLLGASGGTGIANTGLTINLGSATTGYLLTSDSSGNATWSAPGYLTGAVLLAPSGDQSITAHNLLVTQGNLQAGSSGHAGTVTSFPATGTEGSLILAAVNNAGGNFNTTISNAASVGQSQVISIPDSGAATGSFILSATINAAQIITTGQLSVTNGVAAGAVGGGSNNFLASYSPTTAKGGLLFQAANNAGNTNTIITNASMGQASTLTIPDPGASTANFVLTAAAATQTIGSALSVTGNLTPSQTNGIVGTTTNNNANTGSVGEFVSSVVTAASPTNINSGSATDLTSISLTAGDWDVWGNIGYIPAAGTTTTIAQGWLSSSSATIPDASLKNFEAFNSAFGYGFTVPSQRFSLSGTTSIYITGDVTFAVSTMTFYGGIYARRRR